MNFELDQDQRDLRAAIRRYLASEVEPLIDECERTKTFPFQVLPKLAQFGYLGGLLPEEQGGLGIDRVTWAMMIEELGYTWLSLRTMINITNGPITSLAAYGTAEQKAKYLEPLLAGEARVFNGISEPEVGSNVAEIRTRADLDGDEWVLTGRKMWITGGVFAEFGVVVARTFSPTCDGDLSLFLMDRRETEFDVRPVETMVLRCTGTSEMSFDATRIPKGNLLGAEGAALKSTLSGLGAARVTVAMGAVGAAQRALDLSIDYAKNRHQFGKPIGSYQLIQKHIVDMKIRVEAARALGYRAAAALDAGEPARVEGSIAKLYATEAAHEVADMAMQVHGGIGYATEFPIERIFRDTRGGMIPEGTTEIQTLIIGRELLGISAIK